MSFIKKFIIIIFSIFCVSLISLVILTTIASKGYLDKHIKKIAEFYLSKEGVEAEIADLRVKGNKLSISKATFGMADMAMGSMDNFTITVNFDKLDNSWLLLSRVNIDNFSISSNENQELLTANILLDNTIDFTKNNFITKVDLNNIKSTILADPAGSNLPVGQGTCLYKARLFNKNAKKGLDCQVHFGNKASLSFDSLMHNTIEVHGSIMNIPLDSYKIVQKIIPNNEVILYFQEHIKSGHIQAGEFDISLDKDFLKTSALPENALKGNLHITDWEYKYDNDFPPLKEVDTNIMIDGGAVQFIINKAYSGASLLSDGIVTFKWEGFDKSKFIFIAKAEGSVLDLISFIPEEAYQKTKEQGIDLKKATGTASSKIEIQIPISPDIKNTYSISSKLLSLNLAAFNNNVILKNANANGIFNGKKIIFTGQGKINDYASTFMYEHNIEDNPKDDYDSLLKLKTNIISKNKKIGILKVISGSNIVNFEYKKKKDVGIITADSNLNGLEFYLDKISIYKKRYKRANLELKGKLTDNFAGDIEFKVTGEDNLKIIGNALIKDGKYQIDLPAINYGQTDVKGRVRFDKNTFDTELRGNSLDLSSANMMQFLEKESEARNTHLKVDIGRVKLKNDIWLNNLQLEIECDKVRCSSGSLTSNIGSKSFKMLLLVQDGFEQWLINCDNAGALFKGIGMYNDMKSGTINLTLNTKRQEVKKGEIIPILDGAFTIKRFVVTDTPFLTRIVSFVSLPGLMSSIVNNKDILFENMAGQFNYVSNIITLSNSEAKGPFFDFTMKGRIDTTKQQISLKGNVVPSFFFVSAIITKIPVIGKIFSKVAPYSLELKY